MIVLSPSPFCPRGLSAGRSLAVALSACATLMAAACGDATAPRRAARLIFVKGNGQADTVGSVLPQPLAVQVRDSLGAPVAGATVVFTTVWSAVGTYEATAMNADTRTPKLNDVERTDSNGFATVLVKLGTIGSTARLAVAAPDLGVTDTARFTVKPGQPRQIRFGLREHVSYAGANYRLYATAADQFGNPRPNDPVQFTSRNEHATIDGNGVVTAVSVGRAWLLAQSGRAIDSAGLSVVPQWTLVTAEVGQDEGGVVNGFIATVGLDGSSLTHLTPTTTGYALFMPTFNPAGNVIAFFEGDPGPNGRPYLVTTSGVRAPLLTSLPSGVTGAFEPSFSADGQWVYFIGYTGGTGRSSLWRVRTGGADPERLVSDSVGSSAQPSASPDGVHVVFALNGILSVLDLGTRQVTSLGVAGAVPQYSPDGKRIVYLAVNATGGMLTVMNADGTGGRIVTLASSFNTYATPHWSPDGQWIVIRGFDYLLLVNVASGEVLPLNYATSLYQPAFKP